MKSTKQIKLWMTALLLMVVSVQVNATTPPNTVTVAVFSINDFHGAFVQDVDKQIPGAACVLDCLDSLKAVYPYHLTVAAGDNFGGSYFYKVTKGEILPVFFDYAGIRLSAVGNHEFDDGVAELAKKWQGKNLRPAQWDLKYVCANIYDQQGNVPPYMDSWAVEEIRLSPTKSAKIAFVGLLASSAKEQIKAENTVGLLFSGAYTRVLDSLKALPAFQEVIDAPIRNLLVHIGTYMKDGQPKWTDKNEAELYAINDKMYHAILSGHSHEPVCGTINNMQYPVVQGWWHGNYISVMKYELDTVRMEVVGVQPDIVRVPIKARTALSPKALRLQEITDSLLANTKTVGGIPIGTKLTTATQDLPHDRTQKYVVSPVGTLVCSSFSEIFRQKAGLSDKDVVVGVCHFGGIRANITKGAVSVLDVGEVLPFNNNVCAYKVTGKELYELIEYGYHNERYGWIQTSNLEIKRTADNHIKKLTYVSPNGKRKRIKPTTVCYITADGYMTTGGDDYSPRLFPESHRIQIDLPVTSDAFIEYLRQKPQIP